MVNGLRQLTALDLRPRLADLTIPTLVICGEKDRSNLKYARELADGIPAATLRIIPEAGHFWNLESPDRFNQELADFLS